MISILQLNCYKHQKTLMHFPSNFIFGVLCHTLNFIFFQWLLFLVTSKTCDMRIFFLFPKKGSQNSFNIKSWKGYKYYLTFNVHNKELLNIIKRNIQIKFTFNTSYNPSDFETHKTLQTFTMEIKACLEFQWHKVLTFENNILHFTWNFYTHIEVSYKINQINGHNS